MGYIILIQCLYVEVFLHSRSKYHLIMLYNSFNMVLNQFAIILLRSFALIFIKDIGVQLFFNLILSLLDFDISVKVMLASSNEFEIVPFLPNVWKFEKDCC